MASSRAALTRFFGSAAMVILIATLGVPGGRARAASRLVIWLPEAAGLTPDQVELAFGWARAVTVLDASRLATRFPPSQAALSQLAAQARADALLAQAEAAFVETRFEDAARALAECEPVIGALPPTGSAHATWVRARLLAGRVAMARGDQAGAAAAFGAAAAAVPDAALDEAEYPPEVVKAYETGRRAMRARTARTVRVRSEPEDAEVELNGRLLGRTPLAVEVTGGRCHLAVSRPGSQPFVIECGRAGVEVVARLQPAGDQTRRDQLRERLGADPRWFAEPTWVEAVAAAEGATWVLALDRVRGLELEASLYWTRAHRGVELRPPRFGVGALGELAAAVQRAVDTAEGLHVEIATGVPGAPVVTAHAGDPDAVAAAVLFVRRKGKPGWAETTLPARGPGRFAAPIPAVLAGQPGEALHLEYYLEGRDGRGVVQGRVGAPERPLTLERAALVTRGTGPTTPPLYTRWWFWAVAGGVAAAASVGGYFVFQPDEWGVTF